MADLPFAILSAIESTIGAVEGLISDITGMVADVQSAITVAQGIINQQRYFMAAAIAALEFRGLVHIIQGAGELFVGTLKSLGKIIPDSITGIVALFTFAISWMMCLFKNLSNMQTCFLYYMLEIVGQILYLPVRIFLWVLYQFKLDLYPLETSFWDLIDTIDRVVMKYAGFHISHYPKNIRDTCYNCKRLKISTLVNRTTPIATDVQEAIPAFIMPGLNHIAKGGIQLMHPFDKVS